MALRTGLLNLPRWRHFPRHFQTQRTGFSISLPRARALDPNETPKPRSKEGFSTTTAYSGKQAKAQYASDWNEVLFNTAARWTSGWRTRYAKSLSHRLAVYSVVTFFSGMAIVYFFVLELVPITGRRRISWLPQSTLTILEEMERRIMEKLRKNEEKFFIDNDYPGLRKIEAVFNRLVMASGLEDIAWEVRVINEPSWSFPPT